MTATTAATARYVKTRVYYVKLTVTLIKIAVNYSIFYNNVTKFLVIVSLNFLVYFPDLQKSQE